MSELSEIFTQEAISDIKREIVVELLNSDKNLDEKTELKKPLKWSALRSIRDYLDKLKLSHSSAILERFIKQCHKFLISKDRKGRDEYIKALNSIANLEEKEDQKQPNLPNV
jgi:hypothetical protein